MRLQILSDTHLENQPDFHPSIAPDVDVLVLAGDIGGSRPCPQFPTADMALGRFSPAHTGCPVVVLVPGNHEYDGQDYFLAEAELRTACEKHDITFLERDYLQFEGVRILGTTLWADFDAIAKSAGRPLQSEAALAQRREAFRVTDEYLFAKSSYMHGRRMLSEDIRQLSHQCQSWLCAELQHEYAGKTVVVTHFAPSLRSADLRYGIVPATAGFCNAMDDLVPLADLWIHGHLHCANDYRIGACRVVSNSLGCFRKGEQGQFVPRFVVEI